MLFPECPVIVLFIPISFQVLARLPQYTHLCGLISSCTCFKEIHCPPYIDVIGASGIMILNSSNQSLGASLIRYGRGNYIFFNSSSVRSPRVRRGDGGISYRFSVCSNIIGGSLNLCSIRGRIYCPLCSSRSGRRGTGILRQLTATFSS